MKYAFLTTLIPKQKEEEIRRLSRHNMQDAANALQWHIYEGLYENLNTELKIFNVRPIGSFPQYYKKPFVKGSRFPTDSCKENVDVGFCNVKFIRKLHQPKKIYRQLVKWCRADDEEKCLFIYTMSSSFMVAVHKLKKRFPTLKTCAIVADLPDMSTLSSKQSLAQRIFNKRSAAAAYARTACIDAFVLLTRQMADYMKITQPFTVMEGIATKTDLPLKRQQTDERTVLYSGTLHKRFGILNLVQAFEKIEHPDYRLVICGAGDSEEEIKAAAKKDPRISFLGQLPRAEVLALQQTATVLVNPRQNNEEFTKYSFPSKNLEYLSSGIPLVAYKLDGIPDEYDDYINYVSDNSIEALSKKLTEALEDKDGSVAARALAAANFVRDEKNAQKQTRKIVGLLESLSQ